MVGDAVNQHTTGFPSVVLVNRVRACYDERDRPVTACEVPNGLRGQSCFRVYPNITLYRVRLESHKNRLNSRNSITKYCHIRQKEAYFLIPLIRVVERKQPD